MTKANNYRNIVVLSALICSSFSILVAQPLEHASMSALGNSAYGQTGFGASFYNPAALGTVNYSSVLLYGENRFFAEDLNAAGVYGVLPFSSGAFGLTVHAAGIEGFRDNVFRLSYGRKLGNGLYFGGRFNAHRKSIDEFGDKTVYSVDFGALVRAFNDLYIGFTVDNPTEAEWNEDFKLPTIFNFGLAYQINERLSVTAGAEKELGFDYNIKAGVEYRPTPQFPIRVGFESDASLWAFGLGYEISKLLNINVSGAYHQHLGMSTFASFHFTFAQKRSN